MPRRSLGESGTSDLGPHHKPVTMYEIYFDAVRSQRDCSDNARVTRVGLRVPRKRTFGLGSKRASRVGLGALAETTFSASARSSDRGPRRAGRFA